MLLLTRLCKEAVLFVRVYPFKKKKLQKLPLYVLRLVRMGGRPRLVETCCQSHPDAVEKGGYFTPWQQPGCIRDAPSAGLGRARCTLPKPASSTPCSSCNSNNFPFIGLYTQVMTTWCRKHLGGCFRPFAPPQPVPIRWAKPPTESPLHHFISCNDVVWST